MIPKIIHYCWFGKNKKNDLIIKCIESWKKHCSDYEIKEWNEDNFDVNSNQYVKEAYENKKWAFVSDYVRLYALYNDGGIYVDTDLEITKNIDKFLIHKAFTSQEDDYNIPTALMGAEKNNIWICELLKYYKTRHFILENGEFDQTTNVKIITKITEKMFGVKFNNQKKVLGDDIHIYPKEYFCQYDVKNDDINYSIHHFNGSWISDEEKEKERLTYKNYYYILNYIIDDMENNNNKLKKFIGNKDFIIYGYGTLGKMFFKQCKEAGLDPKCIIDKNMRNKDGFINDIRLSPKSNIIIITPVMSFYDIYRMLKEENKYEQIVSLNSVFGFDMKLF